MIYQALVPVLWLVSSCNSQNMDIQPFLSLLRPENMRSMAELATELSSMASKNIVENERDVQRTIAAPTTHQQQQQRQQPTPEQQRPSQMIGGAIQNLAYQGRSAFLQALDKLEASQGSAAAAPAATLAPMLTFPTVAPPVEMTPPAVAPPVVTMAPMMFGLPAVPARPVIKDTVGSDRTAGSSMGDGGRDVLGVREFKKKSVLGDKMKEIRYAEPSVPVAQAAAPSVESSAAVLAVEQQPVSTAGSASSAASAAAATAPLSRPPPPTNSFDGSPFMQIARRFLQVGTGNGGNNGGGANEKLPQIGIRDFVSNADSNFGLPRGKGCLPFISEFMQIAYGNCQDVADEKTFDAWGDELRRAIMTGEIDLLKASQETCRRGAERQQCDSLREAVANCDVMASIEIGSQLQRAMKRCEEVSGMMDQSPAAVLGQLNSLISGEVAQGFLNNFLKNG